MVSFIYEGYIANSFAYTLLCPGDRSVHFSLFRVSDIYGNICDGKYIEANLQTVVKVDLSQITYHSCGQCFRSGSAWIHIDSGRLNPDPDPGG
jgi:hypothetical protein